MKKAWRLPPALIGVFNRYVPFADAASPDLPLARLLRLSLFQVAVGITTALLVGTLNRVMIVELGVPAWWVALSVALPLVFAPMRAFIGYRSDTHPSVLGLRRLPYMWIGSLLMFGGLAIMPFALLVLTGEPERGAIVDLAAGQALLAARPATTVARFAGTGHQVRRVRFADALPAAERVGLEALRTDSASFAAVVESRRNRRDGWYLKPAGRIDLCSVPLPVRSDVAEPAR